MFQLGKQKTENQERNSSGNRFLTEARKEFGELFSQFVEGSEDFSSVEEYTEALEGQAWEMTESIAKASYRNGLSKGYGQRKAGK